MLLINITVRFAIVAILLHFRKQCVCVQTCTFGGFVVLFFNCPVKLKKKYREESSASCERGSDSTEGDNIGCSKTDKRQKISSPIWISLLLMCLCCWYSWPGNLTAAPFSDAVTMWYLYQLQPGEGLRINVLEMHCQLKPVPRLYRACYSEKRENYRRQYQI